MVDVKFPIVAPVKVVEVPAISVMPEAKVALADFSQFTTEPVLPDILISDGLLPLQIVWFELIVLPTLVGSTVTVTIEELASEQTPDLTTALK